MGLDSDLKEKEKLRIQLFGFNIRILNCSKKISLNVSRAEGALHGKLMLSRQAKASECLHLKRNDDELIRLSAEFT